jgi:hypothetical protein
LYRLQFFFAILSVFAFLLPAWRQRRLVSVGAATSLWRGILALLAQASACAALVGSVRFQPAG